MKKNKLPRSPIAIVGTSALFAEAQTTARFWNNIISSRDFTRQVPETHWLISDYFSETIGEEDKVYSCRGSFLPDIPFDSVEHGIPPKTLPSTDTAQLLALIAAKKTLQDTASIKSNKVDSKRISVILGVAAGSELTVSMSARIQRPIWLKALRDSGLDESVCITVCENIAKEFTPWVETTFPGLLSNVVAGRIANRFDLGGANCVVDAACASSLASMKMAIDELLMHRADLVITGGVDALNDIFMYMCFAKTTALSKSGHCRPFSSQADGTIIGEGVGLIALRRLEDAERDGDKIYAVIHAVGSSSDGKAKSVYAPVSTGQAEAINRAYAETPYSVDEVGLIEAHGTGTIAGDAAEFQGLVLAFASGQIQAEKKQFCALGSVKSQIGHTKSAAGVASLLKVVGALQQKVLPPTIKVEQVNPNFDIENSPFYLNTRCRPWIQPRNTSRKASVSSFGFGGSNFHITVEEYCDKKYQTKPYANLNVGALFLFDASDKQTLKENLQHYRSRIGAATLLFLGMQTQIKFNSKSRHRCGFFAENDAMAVKKIDRLLNAIGNNIAGKNAVLANNEVYYSSGAPLSRENTAFLFPGQGSQYVNMGAELCMEFGIAREVWDNFADTDFNGERLHEINFPVPAFTNQEKQQQEEKLTQTEWAQPAIGAVSLSQLALLKRLNVNACAFAGHSYGEITALFAAGSIGSEQDVLLISRKRGELMAECLKHNSGAMSAVLATVDQLESYIGSWQLDIVIANINSPKQVVISGPLESIEQAESQLMQENIPFVRLPVNTAFHSSLVKTAVEPFESFLQATELSQPKHPVYANTTAQPYPSDPEKIRRLLANQLAKPVRFDEQIRNLSKKGVQLFVEVGPGNTLSRFVKDIAPEAAAINLDDKKANGVATFFNALGQLAVYGIAVHFDSLWAEFSTVENELDKSSYSKATVMINGANYKKPYPPKGGAAMLPQPNTGKALTDSNTPALQVERVKQTQVEQSFNQATKRDKLPMTDSDTNLQPPPFEPVRQEYSSAWLNSFNLLQQNMLDAQKLFQESLLQSHTQFMQVTQTAIQQLSGQHDIGLKSGTVALPKVTTADKPVSAIPKRLQMAASTTTTTPQNRLAAAASASTMMPPPVSPRAGQTAQFSSKTSETVPDGRALGDSNPIDSIAINRTDAVSPGAPESDLLKLSLEQIQKSMLAVVAEKTGYPEEMIDLDTDMEAGLGIDSIKRVEILASLQEKMPELKGADTRELAALNTLREILNYAQSNSGTNSRTSASQVDGEENPEKKLL